MFRCNASVFFFAGIVLTGAACSSSGSVPPNSSQEVNSALRRPSSRIQHIVIVMQEARSFDNLFCTFVRPQCTRKETVPLEAACTLSDTFQDFERDRKSGEFDKEHADCAGYQRPEYAHVPPAEIQPYFKLADEYALGDEMFSSTGNPTYEAHQYLIAAQAGNAENQPFGTTASYGCVYRQWVHQFDGDKLAACSTYKTLGDELTEAGLTWNYYYTADAKHPIAETWDAYGWIKGGSAGTSPSSKFIEDVRSGTLASVTWITPKFSDSDLSGSLSCTGPSWVAAVVNAVGKSKFWSTTAVVILWSGFGGWYDHVSPPYLDREGLGFRVPVLVVSPYALRNRVDHVRFETASVLRFVEDTFDLARLSVSDSRANDLHSMFDFGQKPRLFVAINGRPGCSAR